MGHDRRLLFVVAHLGLGGAETQVVALARQMLDRGWHPRVVSIIRPQSLADRLESMGIPCDSLDATRGTYSIRTLVRFRQIVNTWKPAVVHSHTLPANFLARTVRPFVGVPVLITSLHSAAERSRSRILYYRLTDRLSDYTTNVSPESVDRSVQAGVAPRGRIHYEANGVDIQKYQLCSSTRAKKRVELGLSEETFLWLAVGRVVQEKDYPNLLAAAAQTLGKDDRILIVGDGDERDKIESKIRELNLRDRVEILGLRHDVPELMCAADGYVMSSSSEGLPMVLLEAAAAGLPIVTTDVGGIRQIVLDNTTGLVVKSGSPEALAQAMQKVKNMASADHEALGAAARAHVEATFSMSAVADRWIQIYEALLSGTAVPRKRPIAIRRYPNHSS